MNRGAMLGIGLAAVVTAGAAFVGLFSPTPAAEGASTDPPVAVEQVAAITPIAETASPQVDVSLGMPLELASLDTGGVSALATSVTQAAVDPVKAAINIYAVPRTGDAPLTVTFTDVTVPGESEGPIQCWTWTLDALDFDNNDDFVIISGCTPAMKQITYTYPQGGTYTVDLTITFRDPNPDGSTRQQTRRYLNHIVVGGEGEQAPTASFSASDGIVDGTALVPLNDWVPLMYFTMTYGDEVADRVLQYLSFWITCGRNDDPGWDECRCPELDNILDFLDLD